MKYMMISDSHGDAQCLQKAMERWEAEKADALLVLGDLLYHGPRNPIPQGYDPQACVQIFNHIKKKSLPLEVTAMPMSIRCW